MKLYLISLLIIFFLFQFSLSINEIEISASKEWCWTKPMINDPKFTLNENNGGINWGYCTKNEVSSSMNNKKKYNIYISTSPIPNSGTSSVIFITLQGTEGDSEEVVLSSNGLKTGSYKNIKVFAKDVGNLKAIKIRNGGYAKYLCNILKIETETNYWNFECKRPIGCPDNCVDELFVVNLITYSIMVKTSTLTNSYTREPIYIKLIGTARMSPEKILSENGFTKDTLNEVSIDTSDVGIVYGITLSIKGYDNWKPDEIIVKKQGDKRDSEEKIFKIPNDFLLESPYKPQTIKLSKPESHDNNIKENDIEYIKSKAIKLSCTDKLKDNENFGPNYMTKNVNYDVFYAKCPSNCMKNPERAIGMGIHPENSPICINAIVDRAMSFYGGLIAISIFQGLPSYTGGKKMLGIPVMASGSSKKSYTIAKIENVDMISGNVRILDSNGKLSFKGRVEIKSNGVWGTICATGLMPSAAKLICKEIGYYGGKFLNPNEREGRKFCSNYEGLDYCGVSVQQILFSNLNCLGSEQSIIECHRQLPSKTICSHDYDTLIECSNENNLDFVDFNNDALRLIDAEGNPSSNGIGRLEIYRGTWGTICNNKFSEKSAKIACKQMGYFDGKLFGEANSNEMCSNVLGDSLCGDSEKILLTELECDGFEDKIKMCRSKMTTATCSHLNDVIIECYGMGDPSGRSQRKESNKVLDPLIGKLPLLPIRNIHCGDSAKNMYFRGDPGSIFLVNCPTDCTNDDSKVIGTGIYTIKSSICKAAIQCGVMTDEGGMVAVIKSYGQNKYFGSNMRKISSIDSNNNKSSFFISRSNNIYTDMVQMINNNSNFIELEQKINLVSNFNFKNNLLKNYRIFKKKTMYNQILVKKLERFSSFLENSYEENNNNSEFFAFFNWSSPNNDFTFDGKKIFVDLGTINGSEYIYRYHQYSIFIKLLLSNLRGKSQVIFSFGGCTGYSITINTDAEITLDLNCGKTILRSGIYVPMSSFIYLLVVNDSNKIIFYLDGIKISESSYNNEINPKKLITIGKHSAFNDNYFEGKILFIAFFSSPFSSNKAFSLYKNKYVKTQRHKNSKLRTVDLRPCISSCALQAIPGTPGSPIPPDNAVEYIYKGEKLILSQSTIRINEEEQQLSPYKEINCKTTGREIFGPIKKLNLSKRVLCPGSCKNIYAPIFGTIIYSLDSSICISAIHSGLYNGKNDVIVNVKLLKKIDFYLGSKQYGVQSASINSSEASYTIDLAPKIIEISCETTSLDQKFSGTYLSKYLVICPKNCSKIFQIVYGKDIYSGDSSICQAAIHFGAITDNGGEVQFIIDKGLKQYIGSKSYDINSKDREAFIKSIKIFKLNENFRSEYTEMFTSKSLNKYWEIHDELESEDTPSKWNYAPSPTPNSKHLVISQTSSIKLLDDEFRYSTFLILKDINHINTLLKVTLYIGDSNPIGIIFRYKDKNNYYHIRISNSITLMKRKDSKETTIAQNDIHIIPHVKYTFQITTFKENIKVFLQIQNLRILNKIFDTNETDMQRGLVGIATNGNNNLYILGFFVNKNSLTKELNESSEYVSFDKILLNNTEDHRHKYCLNKFYNNNAMIQNCKDYHQYCKFKCNEKFNIREELILYYCYKTCVRDSIQKSKIHNLEMLSELSTNSLSKNTWIPKKGEKCDYRNNKIWKSSIITSVENNSNDPEQKVVSLMYSIGSIYKNSATIFFPNNDLSRCGTKIFNRKDCL